MSAILVIDDRVENREFLATLLSYKGHRVTQAADGVDGLAAVRSGHPDLVICDILMPTMDGFEFVRQLRADSTIAATKVIFYTANYREREAQNLAKACGVEQILMKPCEPEEVLRVIDLALAQAGAGGAGQLPGDFDREHVRLMTDKLSEQSEALRLANEQLAALTELNLQLASERDARVLLDKVCRGARELLGAKYVVLCVRQKNGEPGTYATTAGFDGEAASQLRHPAVDEGFLGRVLLERRSRRLLNPGGDPRDAGLPESYPPVHSCVIAPITSISNAYGWICLIDKVGADEFTEDDTRVISILGAQTGRIYENGSLYAAVQRYATELEAEIAERERAEEGVRRHVEQLEALRALDLAILEAQSPSAIASTGLRYLRGLVPYWGATVLAIDVAANEATILTMDHKPGTAGDLSNRIPLGDYGQSDVALLRQGIECVVQDMTGMRERPPLLEALHKGGARSSVRLPMLAEGELIGVLNLWANEPAFFTPEQIQIARSIADQLAIALRQSMLRGQVDVGAAVLERRVMIRTEQLESANKELEAFSYTVSHDLRAPVRHIEGFLHMLREHEPDLDAVSVGYVERIRLAAQRMNSLIDGLLTLARAGAANFHKLRLELRPLIDEVIAGLPREVGSRKIEWVISPLPAVYADATLIRTVLQNLIENAVKYTSRREVAKIEIGARQGNSGETEFFVRDNGAGYDMQFSNKLFRPFERLHQTKEFEGTGVGLATVRRIISRHGGRVWSIGKVGEGAEFSFTLGRQDS